MKNALIVEDEPLICGVYQDVFMTLSQEGKIPSFETIVAKNYDEAIDKIYENKRSGKIFDVGLLDYRIGGNCLEDNNGSSVGMEIKKWFPSSKILMITSLSDNYTLHSILENLNPDGLLIKSDLNLINFKKDIIAIVEGKKVYSPKVTDFIVRSTRPTNRIDDRDLKIIHLMDKGLSLPEIGDKLGLSISGVEYRKRKIAQNLGSGSSNIQDLLHYARNELNLI